MKLFIVVSEDWSFLSHRLSLALSAIDAGYDVTVVTRLNKFEEKIKEFGVNVINVNFRRSSKTPLVDLYNLSCFFGSHRYYINLIKVISTSFNSNY